MNKELRLKYAIGLSLSFMVIELIGGYFANSIAIYSDAAHLLTDIAGFAIALVATIATRSRGTVHLTYGLVRAEVFGALGSVLSLWLITAFLLYAAFCRATAWFEGNPEPVDGRLMFIVAVFGVGVNICLSQVFAEEHGAGMGHSHSHGHGHESSHSDHSTHDHSHGGYQSLDNHDSATVTQIQLSPVHSSSAATDHDHGHGHGDAAKPPSLITTESSPLIHDSHTSADSHGHDSHDHHDCSSHHHTADEDGEHKHEEEDLQAALQATDMNIEAAYLHVLADLIQSIGVAIAGLLLWFKPHWQIVDPVCTFAFSIFALFQTVPLLRRVVNILLEGTPSHLDWALVMSKIRGVDGVQSVHELHIWSLSSSSVSLTCHVRAMQPQQALRDIHALLRRMGIDHATVQVHDANDSNYCYSQSCSAQQAAAAVGGGSQQGGGGDDVESGTSRCVSDSHGHHSYY